MTTDPSADHPTFTNYSTDQGLSGNNVRAITEDDSGRVYFATGRGLDQLDVATARIRHLTSADGLVGDVVNYCTKDSHGYIWVSTNKGLSRLDPRALHAADEPPSIFLSHVQVEGEDLAVPERGASRIPQAVLSASQNNMLIEYVGLDFQSNEPLRYQHKLEGVDPDWSTPTEQRSINYARLTSGSYRFLVRAVNEEGVVSSEPAVIEFRILPPIWQRWWFLSIAAVLVGLIIYAIHRNRVARLLELERVRTRIASDLHDDLGSSLSRMAILSEVAKQRMTGRDNQPISILTDIAESARGAVDSMSDIVWAIDPRRDDLSSVVFRVRQFASDLLGSKEISWHFQVPVEFDKVKLNPEQRRHIFLIFKEAIINSVRHAACSSVKLELRILDNQIVGEIRDDGHGFMIPPPDQCPDNGTGGHGLENLRARATQLGGRVNINSSSAGTSVRLVVPLKKSMA
jgi:two-component sensor histidine kinase